MEALSYAAVTPVRDEAKNLVRLAGCLREQTLKPEAWVIVDGGSVDGTLPFSRRLALEEPWVHLAAIRETSGRGGPVVRAFKAGLAALQGPVDVLVKLDADISVAPTYFEELIRRFAVDSQLGIASGTCFELGDGEWRERYVTGDHVWGASRAYRASCLAQIAPLEERVGWDGIDVLKAGAYGWRTATFRDLPFRHHRAEGARERSPWQGWRRRGDAMYYMGYRPSFVLARTLHRARSEPAAVGLAYGWAVSMLRREAQLSDREVRDALRHEQRLRMLPRRVLEALGRGRAPPGGLGR